LKDATDLLADLAAGRVSVRSCVDSSLERIAFLNDELQAFANVHVDEARARADELDAELAAGATPPPLFGLPIAVKSNLCVRGRESNCGSRMLAGYRAPYTATAVQRLLDAGAVLVGTTHMDEFAMGSSGENSSFATTRNPWDHQRAPGGSSSGSAVAVAAEMVPLALGSDTGGSVRQPASFCGVTGFKPTYGAISRYGLVAFGSSLDQVGPIARSARDVEAALQVLCGADEHDSTSLRDFRYEVDAGQPFEGLRIGLPAQFFTDSVDRDVRASVEAAIDVFCERGAKVEIIELPFTELAVPTYYVLATAEASSNLARYDGVECGRRANGDGSLAGMFAATREAGFGPEVKRRILLGTYVLSSGYYDAWYGRALAVRDRLRADFARAFESCDLLLGPTYPTPAFPLGQLEADPVAVYQADVLTVPASLAGLPAASVPCGLVAREGVELPVGLQLIGPARGDARVLAAARSFQSVTAHHHASPTATHEGAR